MTGQFLSDDGSGASSPALSFDGDTDTGIYRSAANTMGFSTAGTQRVGISNAGLDMLNALPIRFQDSSGAPFVSLQSPSALSGNVALTLPASITNGGFLQTDGSGNLSFQIVAGVPTSAVFCVAVATVPTGYLECNGGAVSRTTYSALFAIIGTNYGTGNGSSTFNLPDLRGEFIRGFDNGKGTDSGRSIASSQSATNASHNHSISASGTTNTQSLTGTASKISETFTTGSTSGVLGRGSNQTGSFTPSGTDSSPTGTLTIDASHNHTVSVSGTTGSQGSEARPRNIAMMYIIKV